MKSEQQYIDFFTANRKLIDAGSAPALNALRDEAFADFRRLGFPSQKVERYKYTDVDAAFSPDYGLNIARKDFSINPYDSFRCNVPNLSTWLYFVVNDGFYGQHVPASSLPDGVVVDSLCAVAAKNPHFIEKYYGHLAKTSADSVVALNTMLCQDGIVVYIPDGMRLEQPLQIINILHSGVDLMASRRVLVVVGKDAAATILFCDHTADPERAFLFTQTAECFVGQGSSLGLYELEESSPATRRFSNMFVSVAADAAVTHSQLTLQNGLTRNASEICLAERGASYQDFGAVIGDGNEHIDNNLLVTHHATHCKSDILYKYVLDGHSVGAFAGKVLVEHGAQKAESQETNGNLCVGREARMYSQPMLEIYADDVKCNHGSSVGHLDQEALFYIQQRGLPRRDAQLLLQHAFLYDVVRRLPFQALSDRLSHLIELRFRGELGSCGKCNACQR